MSTTETVDIKEVVKQKYGEAALRVKSGGSSCCGASPSSSCADPITTNLYDAAQIGQIPQEAVMASLGCGNPTALAQLRPNRPPSNTANFHSSPTEAAINYRPPGRFRNGREP